MDKISEAHEKQYGRSPEVVACAPGRFHLLGEHTWFFKDKTLSMAVNLPVYVAASRRRDSSFRFYFAQLNDSKRVTPLSLKYKKEDKWANPLKAIVYGFNSLSFPLKGVDFTVYSEVLPSAGFGITSAAKIAMCWVINELFSLKCDEKQILRVIETANRDFLNIENRYADSFAAIYSKESSLVLTDYATRSYELLPFDFANKRVILTDTMVPRVTTWNEESLMQPENVLLLGELKVRRNAVYGGWQYEESKSEINEVLSVAPERTKKHLRCIMNEHKYVLDSVNAIRANNFSAFARAINQSHKNMIDYDISCPEIDWLMKRVQSLGESPDDLRNPVNCGRITGKGFARGVYSILRAEDVDKYKLCLTEYEKIFDFKPKCYEVKPAEGVRLL